MTTAPVAVRISDAELQRLALEFVEEITDMLLIHTDRHVTPHAYLQLRVKLLEWLTGLRPGVDRDLIREYIDEIENGCQRIHGGTRG